MVETSVTGPVMLYDGVCGFCNKSVRLILDHDRRETMRFAALQSSYALAIIERHPKLREVDSVVIVENARGGTDERVYVRSNAALKIASYLGGFWKLFLAAKVIPRPVRDYLYDLFARNRYRLFGKYDSCMLPPPAVRSRFLDV
jgi:predicted DCC family thiol-disulfide oxidoreductase YuxK